MSFELIYRTENAGLVEQTEAFVNTWLNGTSEIAVSTSGSTGPPKKLLLRRDQMEASARRTISHFNLMPGETVVSCLSPHTIGGKMMLVRALLGELRLIIVEPSATPLATLKSDDEPVFCPMVPLQVQHSLLTNLDILTNIRSILLGGAPLSIAVERELIPLGNVHIGFGMTETVSHIAMRVAGDPVYTALEGVSFAIDNDRLLVNDAQLGLHHLSTNDAVKLIDSTHFEWIGRTDFAINSGGIKIHPEQLERLIAPLVEGDFFISSRPHDTFGQECILITESNQTNLETIQDICRKEFGQYAAPRATIVTTLLRNDGGKIDRRGTLQKAGITQ